MSQQTGDKQRDLLAQRCTMGLLGYVGLSFFLPLCRPKLSPAKRGFTLDDTNQEKQAPLRPSKESVVSELRSIKRISSNAPIRNLLI